MEENHVNEADVLQPAITERVAITEMETVVETENNFVGDEQQHINSHTTTEPCPAAVTEDGDEWQHNNTHTTTEPFPTSGTEVGDESQHNDTQTTREGKEYNPFIPVPPGDEPLCPGDVIFYWHDLYMCRNPMGERYATIQDGDPDRYPILRLDTMDPLSNMHRVKRIKVITWWSPAGQW